MASGYENKTIKLRNIQNGFEIGTLKGQTGFIYWSLGVLNERQILVSGSYDKTIKL